MPQEQAPMYREIQWSVLESSENGDCPSDTALQALECASTAALAFDAAFSLRSKEREQSIPLFDPEEIMIGGRPYRSAGYFTEYELRRVRIVMDLAKGAFHSHAEQARSRFAERVATESGQGEHDEYENSPSSTSSASSSHYYYAVKYLQAGLMESDHATTAAVDMILETKILMNLAPHPNIMQIYGVNGGGIDSLLAAGRRGFFIVTDRLSSTLVERLADWRRGKGYGRQQQQQNDGSAHEQQQPQDDATATSGGSAGAADEARRFTQRLEIALDIASALVYLHDRELVLNVRPEKVGFDTRYDRIKLCNFSQARQDGMTDHARSITKSDNVVQTLAYTAPEVLCKAPVTVQTDVFAFGIMLWEMMSLKIPFEGYDRSSHFEEVVQFDHRPTIMPKWPADLKKLLQGCWDPHFRPTMKMVHETLETALLFTEDEPEKKQEFVTLRRQESGRHFEQQQQNQSSQSSLLDNNNDDADDNDEDRMESQHQDSLSSPTGSPSVKSGGGASASASTTSSSRTGRHVVRVPANKARSRSKDRRKSGDSSSGSSSLHNITMTPKSSSSRSIRKIKKGVDPPQSPATVSGSSTPGKSSTTTRKKKIRSASLTKQHQQQMNKSFADMDSLLTELGLEEPDASFLDHYTDKHKKNSNNHHHHHHDADKDNDEEGTSHTHNADASSSSGGSIEVNHAKDESHRNSGSSTSTARRSSSRGRAQSRRPSAKQSAAGGRSRSRSKDRRGHSRSRSLSVNRSKHSGVKAAHRPEDDDDDDDDRERDGPRSPPDASSEQQQHQPSSPNARSSSSSRRHISKSPSRKSSHGNTSNASMRSSTSSRSRSGSTTQQRRGSKHGSSSSSSIQRSQSGDFEYPSSPAAAASSGREPTTRRVLVRRKSSSAGGGGSKGGSNSSSNRSSSLTAQIKQEMSHSRRQYNSSKKSSSSSKSPAGHASMSQIDFSTNSTDSHDWDE